MSDPLSDFLAAEEHKPSSCSVCADAELCDTVLRFMEAKARGETAATLSRFRSDCVVARMGKSTGESTLRRHIRTCMARDHKTGAEIQP